jgi:hypothetical protein
MSNQNKFERVSGGAVIPKMEAVVNEDGAEKRGAPIPNMQPVQSQPSASGEHSTGASESGQNDNKK